MFHRKSAIHAGVAFLMAVAGPVQADVRMPVIFGDHMVLQQEMTLPVWGNADPGEKVTVTVADKSAGVTADADGKWMVKLPPLPNGAPPVTMTVSGKNKITFNDVLVGDVWLCSGQSNMEFPLAIAHDGSRVIPQAADPDLRLFCYHHRESLQPLFGSTDPNTPDPVFSNSMQLPAFTGWVACTPENVRNFSAAGYFFGSELRSILKRPIGLIESAWGGTPAQAWTSLSGLRKEPSLQHYVDLYEKDVAAYPSLLPGYADRLAAYQSGHAKLLSEEMPAYNVAVKAWTLTVSQAKEAGQPGPPKPVRPTGPPEPKDPMGGKSGPANLFNGMIAPLIPYAIKGVIWYQGEANFRSGPEYRTLFGRMITDWRETWGEGDFPFLYVQIASHDSGPDVTYPFLREAQLKTLLLPGTGMASAVDLGDFSNLQNIHPQDKHDVGHRLALAAEHVAYGQDVVSSGPVFDSFKVEGNAIRVKFTQTGGGLMIGRPPWINPRMESSWITDRLAGFEIAGVDGNYVPADARIDGNSVVVSSPQVAAPVYVRFAWSNVVRANLYNREGLPAPLFRTDAMPPAYEQSGRQPAAPKPAATPDASAPSLKS